VRIGCILLSLLDRKQQNIFKFASKVGEFVSAFNQRDILLNTKLYGFSMLYAIIGPIRRDAVVSCQIDCRSRFVKKNRKTMVLKPGEKRTVLNFLESSSPETNPNPKGYFANERTFLHWQSLCLVLGALGIGLVNFAKFYGQVIGLLFTSISLFFSVYSLVQYLKRSDLLAGKEKGISYEDINGLLLMVFVLFIAIGINFGLHFLQ
jgi:uncharacterized membrane protein YidH (DUF202 family)